MTNDLTPTNPTDNLSNTTSNTALEATMTDTLAKPNTPAPIAPKFQAIETAMQTDVLERQREIHAAIIALVSRKHFFMVGPPGVAKSFLVRRMMDRIDFGTDPNAYFQWLLTKYTTPEEVFGPPSLAELEKGNYKRNTEQKLPTAKIAFLDEIFKANSSILNALLTIMNERLFFNNGDQERVELSSIFGASNELPDDEGLHALWDRLHFRFEVKPLQESGNFVRMLSTHRVENPEKLVTWDEIGQAQTEAAAVELPTDIYDALKALRDNLKKDGVEPTERRFVEALDIIKAEAWFHGRTVADIDDLRPLRHVMWSRLEEQRVVERNVLELGNPIDKEANELLERVELLDSQLSEAIAASDGPKAVAKQAVEIHAKLHKSKSKLDDLQKRAKDAQRQSDTLEELNRKFTEVAKRLMKDGFGMDGD